MMKASVSPFQKVDKLDYWFISLGVREKQSLCQSNSKTVDDLRQRIIREIDHVKRDQMMINIKRSVRDMIRRARMCVQEGGKHIERLLENK